MTQNRNPFTMTGADVGAELHRLRRALNTVISAYEVAPHLLQPGDLLAIGEHCGPLADACETANHHAKVATYYLPS